MLDKYFKNVGKFWGCVGFYSVIEVKLKIKLVSWIRFILK